MRICQTSMSKPPKRNMDITEDDDIFGAPSMSKPPKRNMDIIEDDDIFSALPKSSASIPAFGQAEDDDIDIFSAPAKSKPSNKSRVTVKAADEGIISKDEGKSEEDALFSATPKTKSSSRDQGKTKSKPKKVLDDDLFGDEFDLFSDIPAKPKVSVRVPPYFVLKQIILWDISSKINLPKKINYRKEILACKHKRTNILTVNDEYCFLSHNLRLITHNFQQSKKEKKGTKAKKPEASKSKDFIDPLFQ